MLIAPAQISLTAYDSCRFRVLNDAGDEVAASWQIQPGDLGTISPEGTYTAPRWIWFPRSVVVRATAIVAAGKPQSLHADVKLANQRAVTWSLFLFLAVVATGLVLYVVDVAPREAREARFEIAPREVVLTPGQQQQFFANGDVKWSANAPGGLFTATVTSQAGAGGAAGAAGTATSGGGAGGAASTASTAPGSPAIHARGGVASTDGGAGNGDSSAASAGGQTAGTADGAKAREGGGATEDVVFATNRAEADWVDSAHVKLHPTHYLRIEPARPVIAPGETLRLQLDTDLRQVTFEPTADGLCNDGGVCEAKNAPSTDRVVLVRAKSSDGTLKASVNVRFVGTRSSLLSPMLIALLFGALGGLLHALNSLVGYVGNDKFLGRWSFYYLARPFIGAVVGVIVMLVFRGGLAADSLKSGFYPLAAVAALAGLFSDPATHKLKEIFDVVLGPKRDDRTNTMEGTAPRPPAPAAPAIVRVTPPELVVGNAVKLTVIGSGFSSQSRAQIDAQDRETKVETATQLTVQLKSEDVARARQLVLVITDGAARSGLQVIDVKDPPGGSPPVAPATPPVPATPRAPATPSVPATPPASKSPATPPLDTTRGSGGPDDH